MPLVLSDASTLIHLAAIGQLALLRDLYQEITIPAAVWQEVVEEGRGRVGTAEVEAARQVAERYGLPKTGVIGVLIRAKREGKIASLQAELDRLRSQGGFWIAEDLYQRTLQAVGEK